MKILSLVTSVLVIMAATGKSVVAEEVQVQDAYVRAPIPGRMMSAAFMTLMNTSGNDRTLISAHAEWAGSIEIHTHTHDDGVMRMRQIESLIVPAGQEVVLKPGGLHLMLFQLNHTLPTRPELTLCFQNGDCQQVQAELKDMR